MPGPTTSDELVHDRYLLRQPLGHGGMGMVRRGRDTLVGRDVAVKEIELPAMLEPAEQRELRAKIIREARAAVGFIHPGAVRAYDVVEHEGTPMIILEMVHAPTLAQVVERNGPLPAQRAAAIGRDVLEVLAAAHDYGMVHRHVAPTNIVIPTYGPARLSDFGITPYVSDPRLAGAGVLGGSPHYFAPEQVSAHTAFPASDLWSLGATLYFAVEGTPPFAPAGTPSEVLAAIVEGRRRPARRSGPLEAFFDAVLVTDPYARADLETVRALLEAVAGDRASARGTSSTSPTEEPAPLDPVVALSRMFSPDPHATDTWEPLDLNTGAGALPGSPPPAPWPVPYRRLRKSATLLSFVVILVLLSLLITNGQQARQALEREAAARREVVVTVPPQWPTYSDSVSGFALSHPPGWSVARFGSLVRFQDPETSAFVQISYSGPAQRSATDAVHDRERRRFPPGTQDYRRLQITPSKFANSEATIWEFTYKDAGVDRHEVDIDFNTPGYAFTLEFQGEEKDWDDLRPRFAAITTSFSVPI